MKTDVQRPNIIRIAYHQEPGDPHYGSCLWAYFDLDLDKYMLSIQSDCGNATYRWNATPETESFLHLLARINDDDYLLEKLFSSYPDVVDIDATLDEVREEIGIGDVEYRRDETLDDDARERLEGALEWLKYELDNGGTSSRALSAYIIDQWSNEYDLGIDCVNECVHTDYAAWQKRIVGIMLSDIRPVFARLAKDQDRISEANADNGNTL